MGVLKNVTRQQRKRLETENRKRPVTLQPVAEDQWPRSRPDNLMEVWQSRDYLVQVYQEQKHLRLSVCRTTVDPNNHRWNDGISWDDLQALKRQCGRGTYWAVEVYPDDRDIVNVANMRHLWLLETAPEFVWRQA